MSECTHTPLNTLTVTTSVPQGCVLSPLLYSLFTHDCVPNHNMDTIIKFADGTTIFSVTSDNSETWPENNMAMNAKQDQGNHRLQGIEQEHSALNINNVVVESVAGFYILGVCVTENTATSWSISTITLWKALPYALRAVLLLTGENCNRW